MSGQRHLRHNPGPAPYLFVKRRMFSSPDRAGRMKIQAQDPRPVCERRSPAGPAEETPGYGPENRAQ